MSLALIFFFFKQKTAYEMRISDWSSDVCSSDLGVERLDQRLHVVAAEIGHEPVESFIVVSVEDRLRRRSLFQEPLAPGRSAEIGERRIIGIAAVVDPGLESVSALLLESGLKLLAIFQGHDAPAAGRANLVEAAEHAPGRRRDRKSTRL